MLQKSLVSGNKGVGKLLNADRKQLVVVKWQQVSHIKRSIKSLAERLSLSEVNVEGFSALRHTDFQLKMRFQCFTFHQSVSVHIYTASQFFLDMGLYYHYYHMNLPPHSQT